MTPSPTESTVQERELLEAAKQGTRTHTAAWSRPTAQSSTPTATACSAPCTTPRTPSRTPWFAPGGACRSSRDAARCAPGSTGSPPTPSWTQSSERPKRVLPIDYGPPPILTAASASRSSSPSGSSPIPDETLGLEDGYASPDARYEQRESVELAFIAALQYLPANQRAVLILREVLGFSAREVAETLDTSVASVNSALQRARATIEKRLPDQSQQETLRSLGDERLREIVEEYVDAWERDDVDAVVAMLAEDAAFTMPPMAAGSGATRDPGLPRALARCCRDWGWRSIPTIANGQPALAFYSWDEEKQAHRPVRTSTC